MYLLFYFQMNMYRDNIFKLVWFVSELRQVGGFPRVLRFPPQIKLTATI